jgi:hypothetical protein
MWESKTPPPYNSEHRHFGYIMRSVSEDLEVMIKYLRRVIRVEPNDDYMSFMVHCERYSSTAWMICNLMSDTFGQGLVEARLREGWEDAEELIETFSSTLDMWLTKAQFRKNTSLRE